MSQIVQFMPPGNQFLSLKRCMSAGAAQSGSHEAIIKMLKEAGIEYAIYDKVEPNPTIQQASKQP